MYQHIKIPANGKKIEVNSDNTLNVPNNPIIPFIEGDGIGIDITPVMRKVVDAAVDKAYQGQRKISWMEIYAGEKSTKVYGPDVWLPDETLTAAREFVVSIKGPLTTPIGGGHSFDQCCIASTIRSLCLLAASAIFQWCSQSSQKP